MLNAMSSQGGEIGGSRNQFISAVVLKTNTYPWADAFLTSPSLRKFKVGFEQEDSGHEMRDRIQV